jgi:hypothetical protein
VQAFTQPCPGGETTIQPSAVECVTNATAPGTASTSVQIADVFADWPGHATVSASVSAGSISLYTSLGGPNLASLPSTEGYDALTATQTLSLAPNPIIGLYGSLVHADELLAVVDVGTVPSLVVLTLNEASGQWSAGAPIALSSLSTAQQQQAGLFGAGGCFPTPVPRRSCITSARTATRAARAAR